MNKLIHFEFVKAFKKKSFLYAVILMIILMIALPCITIHENQWVTENGVEITGLSAIRAKKKALADVSCDLTAERLGTVITNYQSAYADPSSFYKSDGTPISWINNTSYAKYIQNDSEIKFLIDLAFTLAGGSYDYYAMNNMSASDAERFYVNRMNKVREYLDRDYTYGNYSDKDKEYFIAKNEKIKTPFHYSYNEGWKKILPISYFALVIIAMVVSITLAPMFSSEYQTGADAILLSTKYGRSKLIIAKIASSFLLTSFIYCIGMLVLTIATLFIYGGKGAGCSLQVTNFLAPANVSLFGAYLYVLFAGYCMCLLMQGITLLLSAKMQSPFSVIICTMLFFFAPMFISYSKTSRRFNKLLDLTPVKMAAANTALTKYEVYHILFFKVHYSTMIIIVALLIAILPLPLAYKAFHKHQVA